jgi:DNA-binding NarL/FixJ family response regulator
MRVVVVDDHAIVADGLVLRLGAEPDIEIVGMATQMNEALVLIGRLQPDVVLCDVMLGDAPTGLEVARRLRASLDAPPPVLLLSSYGARYFQRTALANGAAGYVLKSATTSEVCAALRAVAKGGTAFAASIVHPDPATPRAPSERERQVIIEVSRGGGNDDIGQCLGITSKTIESHLSRMFTRYGVSSRTELAVLAVREGWIVGYDLV